MSDKVRMFSDSTKVGEDHPKRKKIQANTDLLNRLAQFAIRIFAHQHAPLPIVISFRLML
jgi:hypothetical protein